MKTTNCFKCGKELEVEDRWESENPETIGVVYGASIFRCYGNYGSRKFDPSPSEEEHFMEIIVCDDCTEGVKIVNKTPEHLERNEAHQAELRRRFVESLEGEE